MSGVAGADGSCLGTITIAPSHFGWLRKAENANLMVDSRGRATQQIITALELRMWGKFASRQRRRIEWCIAVVIVLLATTLAEAAEPPAPYPASELITGIEWAPVESTIRLAPGSDNWPLTWADDGHLYTAYGDGWGFDPSVERKLSLGLARIEGRPPELRGINIRSADVERPGDGAAGPKASGMLMIDGVLYMLARNTGNSQLAWSKDHGRSWTWADWTWQTSFGCPTFVNFGRNYAGARDDFAYMVSVDASSAYDAADGLVLARVPHDRLGERDAYEFFSGPNAQEAPRWSREIEARKSMFVHPGRCYRTSMTYNAPLDRYLLCHVMPESTDPRGPRFQGGFGIYEAPQPWGPWRTVYFTNSWDCGPGETSSFPAKWMSDDGRTLWLVFSGDDCFSVRRANLTIAPPPREVRSFPGQR